MEQSRLIYIDGIKKRDKIAHFSRQKILSYPSKGIVNTTYLLYLSYQKMSNNVKGEETYGKGNYEGDCEGKSKGK